MLIQFADIKLDAGFQGFYRYCESADIPVVIISRYNPPQDSSTGR